MVLIETQKDEFTRLKDINLFDKVTADNSINGDLLVIGLGGIGRTVLTSFKGMMKDRLKPEDNVRYLYIDSSIPEMEDTIQASKDGVGMNALEILSIYRPNLDDILEKGYHGQPVQDALAKWMPSDFPKIQIGTNGADANRQIGRLMFSNAYEDLRVLLFEQLEEAYTHSQNGRLDVIIVTSTCGGTGSGILSDLAYNIKAYAHSKKWTNFRIGGCLMMPDVLFSDKALRENEEKRTLLQANSFAMMDEMSRLMQAKYKGETYTFESTTHRLSMCDNIFDSCMLVSGRQDEQGYIPTGILCSDVAYFLTKLASNKFITEKTEGESVKSLLRDSFFKPSTLGYFKVINEADYRIPIREIEHICEGEIFKAVADRLKVMPPRDAAMEAEISNCFDEVRNFLNGKPGDEVNLDVKGLIHPGQFTKPAYKLIKKRMDEFTTVMPRQIENLKNDMPVIAKSVRINLATKLNEQIDKCLHAYGPFVTMNIIGARGINGIPEDTGMVAEVKELQKKLEAYEPSNEFERIIESIHAIVAKRFFAFPSAKKETENGYFDASVKSALAKERNMLMDEMNRADVLEDLIFQLRQRSEQIYDIFVPFFTDLQNAVNELAADGKRITGFLLKDAARTQFLPKDYMSEERINDMLRGLNNLMVDHENDINIEKIVPISDAMTHLYKNFLIGVGVYAPEKLIATAFADDEPTQADINMMFVAPDSPVRKAIMNKAAKAFVEGSAAKVEKKRMCQLKDLTDSTVINKKYISLPSSMPYFSDAVESLCVQPPYNDDPSNITRNEGEMVITADSFYLGVRPQMLENYDESLASYDKATEGGYMGIHIF